jgi:hypothetical protein
VGTSESVSQNEHLINNLFSVPNYFTELYENLKDSSVTEITSQTNGCSLHIRHCYFINYA